MPSLTRWSSQNALPVADEVAAEAAARLLDPVAPDELDEVGRLIRVELVVRDQAEPHGRRGHALLEVFSVEAEAMVLELDDVVVARDVVRLHHPPSIAFAPVSIRLFAASVAVTVVVVGAVWVSDLSFQRAVLLAPVLVIGLGAVAGLVVFWGRIGWDSLRRSRHPRLIAAGALAFVALLVVLTLLGVNLPHE